MEIIKKATVMDLIIINPHILSNRDSIIDLFSPSPLIKEDDLTEDDKYQFKIYQGNDGKVKAVGVDELIVPDSRPFLNVKHKFTLPVGTLPNQGKESFKTTVGNYFINYIKLVIPFNDKIPYQNKKWNTGAVEKIMIDLAIEGKVSKTQIDIYAMVSKYLDTLTEFFSTSITKEAVTVDPSVAKLRKELRAKHGKGPVDPKLALQDEDKLLALDRKTKEGTDAELFLISGKNFNVHRKRMFLGIGVVEGWGDGAEYENISTVLDDGFQQEDLPALANDVRRGFSKRGSDTAKGGAIMKLLARIANELKAIEDDCKTKRHIKFLLEEDMVSTVLHRTIFDNGKEVLLTKDIVGKYIGKVIKMRSAMTCETKGGLCYKCLDYRFHDIGKVNLNIAPMGIGTTFQKESMKSMHGTKFTSIEVDSISKYLL